MGELMQLIAYGYQNTIMADANMYVLGLNSIQMKKNIINNFCIYSCDKDSYIVQDSHMVSGIIFELDDFVLSDIHIKEKISDILPTLKLNIYTLKKVYNDEQKTYLDTDTTYYIGSIPLYLADFKFIKNKIILKFPSNFFNKYNYFLRFPNFKYELEIPLKNINFNINNNIFKNVDLQIITKVLSEIERNIIESYMKILSHNPVQYSSTINNDKNYLYEDKINNFKINNILKIKINKIEKIRGFFIYIPSELDGYINKIVFNLFNLSKPKTVYFKNYYEISEQSYPIQIFKENELFTVYWVGINCLDTNPYEHDFETKSYCLIDLLDSIDIFFDSFITNLDNYPNYINNISFDILIKNYLVGTNYNQMLKYVNGQLNSELEFNWIEKYNIDLYEKIKIIIKEFIELQKAKNVLTAVIIKEKPENYIIEKYLLDENFIYLTKKYIGLY